jgi:hypothetical protein
MAGTRNGHTEIFNGRCSNSAQRARPRHYGRVLVVQKGVPRPADAALLARPVGACVVMSPPLEKRYHTL